MSALSRTFTALGLAGLLVLPAQAGIFDDDEARRAILDLRQKLEASNEANRAKQAELNVQMADQLSQLKRSLLDLNNQLESVRAELARMRGQDEQLARDVAELQRRSKDAQSGIDERIRKLEPVGVTLDDKQFLADPEEKRQYDEAFALIRKGDFGAASAGLSSFLKRYPLSGYADSATFWLGNAQYGQRQYKEAIASFRTLLAGNPAHPKAPEAMLAIANCQIELKESKAARKTIGDLVQAYPKSEAAQAGRERLASLK
ncbi:MAG TPA: tol-pal system protein YbgF [Piscinibacter sp.]|jgi:tol-pal system protein YbgF|uniref:tol-pal system protein YbgF n=1 Tax=Piscinibacter sp. TaxID=1903157 RepID=UPI0011D39634|nr:MAG: tol-pal system protein YbgF [Burkholderiaceae bacterium]HNJ82829.1 tol-pal system protein YbgF [Piscinibacter sp.]HNK17135.1 tol-pal system protein YbgF [Piscinibacter sp.]